MKSVSGTLKLDLAQFRELAAFSQIASDLDADTKAQLDRGERMMELLKQDVYSPVPVPKQVCSFYAGGKGYLDAIATDKVLKFEADLYASLDKDAKVLESIVKEGKLIEKTEEKLIKIIEKVVELHK